ncbi:MAG: DUF4126 domain-containing protein [Candidatus Omnitrophica bacterium]|nr:DUF4126 domain-containing protein [Candidatus Omnitrophota bacterium]
MGILNNLGVVLGGSWASGVNLYLTIAGLGVADRAGWIDLPGKLEVLSHPLVIFIAVLLFLIEFFADKIPYVDSAWDSFHTAIRPAGAAVLTFMALSDMNNQAVQLSIVLLSGAIALDAHLTKATTRVAINTSPEPFTNIGASVTEDALVLVALWLIMTHPVIAGVLVISFIVFSIWFLKTMFRFLRKVFSFAGRKITPKNTVS